MLRIINRYIQLWSSKIFGLDYRKISASSQILIYLGLGLTGINLISSVYDFYKYSGTDLRIRIVGARAMLRGINPYTLDYTPELPAILQDPDQYGKGLSRCPYPPSLLLFYTPLSPFPYPAARGISMVLEWCALITTIALLARTLHCNKLRVVLVIIALNTFAGSYFWRLHVERGQYHVFVTLLYSWGAYEVSKKRQNSWKIGIPFGLALSIRPTVAVVLLVLALSKSYKTTATAIGITLTIFLLTLPFGGLRFWQDWRTLVNRYEAMVVGSGEKLQPIDQRLPAEGFYPKKMLDGKTDNSSAIKTLKDILREVGIQLEPQTIEFMAKASVAVSTLLFLLLFVWADSRRKFSFRFTLYYAIFVSIMAEFIAPIRFGYADTQLLLLIALSLPTLLRPNVRLLAAIVILGLLPGNYPFYRDRFRVFVVSTSITILYGGTVINRISQPADNTPD